ncbi:50S ribosomal protein L35 [Candidatus Wolfebacteria bacterium]|nr:50S ribosomal protein L35 [Candidatus Wolfebacteria bacterium]
MKTNKSFTKRLRVTRRGKVLARKPGGNHFNAKESRSKQLKRKILKRFELPQSERARFLPGQ